MYKKNLKTQNQTKKSPTSNPSPSNPAHSSNILTTPPLSGHYSKHAVDRRDKRHKELVSKYKSAQNSLKRREINIEI